MDEEYFKKIGVITEGHFVLSGGDHTKTYFNKRQIFRDPDLTKELAEKIADKYKDCVIDTVVGIATGGIVLSHMVALGLEQIQNKKLAAIWAEKEGNGFKFPQSWGDLVKGKNVLIVEDVISTGGAVRKVMELCREGNIVGIGVILNRGNLTNADFNNLNLQCIYDLYIERWAEEECPLCAENVPVSTGLGHGKEYVETRI